MPLKDDKYKIKGYYLTSSDCSKNISINNAFFWNSSSSLWFMQQFN